IEATPSAIDFGPVDVAGPPALRTVTLTNLGAVALDVDAPACGGAFSATGAPAHLVTGASTTTTVTYLPAGEQTDTGTISFGVVGGAPIVIAVQGRGIDRHLRVAAPAVAQAFRNAGGAAPIVSV